MACNKDIIIEHISGTCKYHRTVGKKYKVSELTPDGFCPYAYFAAYPYVLGMLHGAQFSWMKGDNNHVFAQCPALVMPCVLEIFRKKDKEGELKVFIKIKERNERVNIANVVECECPHYREDTFEINKGDGKGFCPAAFHQIFPYLKDYIKNQTSSVISSSNEFISVCPDNNNNVTFRVTLGISEEER